MSDETKPNPTRRTFMIAGAVTGGALLLGIGGITGYLALHDRRGLQQEGLDLVEGEGPLVNLWIRITPDNRITLVSPHTEMGQGAQTGLLQIVADELDADWEQMDVVMAPATAPFTNGALARGYLLGDQVLPGWIDKLVESGMYTVADTRELQITGGSTSIRGTGWNGLRHHAASARALLVKAAAEALGVPASELTTASATVTHAASGRSVTYGEVAELASTLSIPRGVPPKAPGEHRYVGTSMPRIDLPDKIFGTAEYGIDAEVEGMRYGAVVSSGAVGTAVTAITNAEEITARRGVDSVHVVHEGVGVVADNPWRAEQAVRAVRFEEAPHASHQGVTTETLLADQRAAIDAGVDTIHRAGNPDGRLTDDVVEAEYIVPFLAQAPMEPLNALVWSEGGKTHITVGVQAPLPSRNHVARMLDVDPDDVVLHTRTMGGGFGRRSARISSPEYGNWLTHAAQLHRASGKPVKMLWSREQDTRRAMYRPMVLGKLRGRVGDDGLPVAWDARVFGSLVEPEHTVPAYAIANVYTGHVDAPPYLPWGAWRSVDASQNAFFTESFVDELARAGGRDPVEVRLAMLAHRPRHATILQTVAEMSGWRRGPDAQGRALGVAVFESFGSIVGQVAEVSASGGTPRVHRVWAAIDCGFAINPDSVEAQIQGAVQYGLTAALYGRIDIEDGAVKQSNFHDYPIVRMADAPRTEVRIVKSDGPVGGAGEPGVPPVAPAVANALAELGERKRRLPLS
ncbi:MAG: molybdopterin cofactor-binding domain-containing protein [Myxococcota bacterium]